MPSLFDEISQQIRQQEEDNLKSTLQRVHENRGRDLPGSENLQLAEKAPSQNPYKDMGLPMLEQEIFGGMKVGDLIPIISSMPEGQAPWEQLQETFSRDREGAMDYASMPGEVLSALGVGPRIGRRAPNKQNINWDPKAMDKVEQMTKQVAPLLSKMNPSEVNLHNALQKTLLKEPMSVGKFSEVGGPKSEFNAFVQAQRKGGAEGKFMNDIELDAQGFSHLLKRRIIDQGLAGESPEVIAKALRSHIEEPSKGISRAAKTTGIGTKMSSSKGTGGTVLKAGSQHSGMNRNKVKIVSSFKDRKG